MKRGAVVAAVVGALALSGCQTTGTGPEYVKYKPGPSLEVATVGCKAYAAQARHIVIGVGSVEAAAIGLIATLAATAAARANAFQQCMVVQGYRKNDGRTPQAAPAPAPKAVKSPARAPAKTPAKTAVRRAG